MISNSTRHSKLLTRSKDLEKLPSEVKANFTKKVRDQTELNVLTKKKNSNDANI